MRQTLEGKRRHLENGGYPSFVPLFRTQACVTGFHLHNSVVLDPVSYELEEAISEYCLLVDFSSTFSILLVTWIHPKMESKYSKIKHFLSFSCRDHLESIEPLLPPLIQQFLDAIFDNIENICFKFVSLC